MKEDIIGRQKEIKRLEKVCQSNKSEFITIYGRRRVGKTFLITSLFENKLAFYATGIIDGDKEDQMSSFYNSLKKYGCTMPKPESWYDAFDLLSQIIENKSDTEKKIIFLDEIPCFDTPRMDFVKALGYFWNSFVSLRKDIVLIVCGSATSWIVSNIIDNHGGLHNRTTGEIYLQQFTLGETEKYLKAKKFHWNRKSIAEAYMIFGGIPYYLSLLENTETLAANIDRLYFAPDGELRNEYQQLYNSLFKNSSPYIKIIEKLAESKSGLSKTEISQAAEITQNGDLTQMLDNLQYSGLIRSFYGKSRGKIKKRGSYYQITDLFTLFHITFASKHSNPTFWQDRLATPQINTWCGLAFERVCLWHIPQIRKALGLNRIAVEYYSWRSNNDSRAQIDLIIERADRLINICEIKFANSEYSISKTEDLSMRNRIDAFRIESGTRCGLIPTWITTYGLKQNLYSNEIQYQVTIDDLFND